MAVMIPWKFTSDWASQSVINQLCFQVPQAALSDVARYMPNLPPLPWHTYTANAYNFEGILQNPNGTLSHMGADYTPYSAVLANAGPWVSLATVSLGVFGAGALTLLRKHYQKKSEARVEVLEEDSAESLVPRR